MGRDASMAQLVRCVSVPCLVIPASGRRRGTRQGKSVRPVEAGGAVRTSFRHVSSGSIPHEISASLAQDPGGGRVPRPPYRSRLSYLDGDSAALVDTLGVRRSPVLLETLAQAKRRVCSVTISLSCHPTRLAAIHIGVEDQWVMDHRIAGLKRLRESRPRVRLRVELERADSS